MLCIQFDRLDFTELRSYVPNLQEHQWIGDIYDLGPIEATCNIRPVVLHGNVSGLIWHRERGDYLGTCRLRDVDDRKSDQIGDVSM